jgi:hypothetical protein
MEAVMPRDDLTTLLNSILSQLDRLERKQDDQTIELNKIHLQTQKTNGRVNQAEKDIKGLQVVKGRTGLKIPPEIWKLLGYLALIVAAVVAGLLGINLKEVFPG